MVPPVLEVDDLNTTYQRRVVLDAIDLSVDGPALVAIVGPNGAGKSTFLKSILGLVPCTGSVRVLGQPIDSVRRRIGYVPQRESVDWDFPVSVGDVALMGTYGRLGWFRRPGAAERRVAQECLSRVGLDGLEDRQIGRLSGGQQQRTFLARALAQQADVYFMDEPMAGVDASTQAVIFDLLDELRDAGKTVFVVHHDLRTVASRFDRVVMLNRRLIAAGPMAEVFTTENLQQTYDSQFVTLDEAIACSATTR
ncbi:MAG: metal ABC transporter ATP-binding protein [Planctomycetia bacterium]|nr:metal ABC transporter ATP-binding protein [Planctomycetia bacterium]